MYFVEVIIAGWMHIWNVYADVCDCGCSKAQQDQFLALLF